MNDERPRKRSTPLSWLPADARSWLPWLYGVGVALMISPAAFAFWSPLWFTVSLAIYTVGALLWTAGALTARSRYWLHLIAVWLPPAPPLGLILYALPEPLALGLVWPAAVPLFVAFILSAFATPIIWESHVLERSVRGSGLKRGEGS